MNEEELKKGCGKIFEYTHFGTFIYCGEITLDNNLHLCPTCKARLEGFQKGKLEQKKEELRFLLNIQNWFDTATGQAYEVNDKIMQLKKEIGDDSHSSQSGSKTNDNSVTNSVIDCCSLKSSGSDTQDLCNNCGKTREEHFYKMSNLSGECYCNGIVTDINNNPKFTPKEIGGNSNE